jgi:flagellar biosynthesis protein FlhG
MRAQMIAVASGKGGTGKTVLSVGLAQASARLGLKTLLFDGDFGLANVDVQLGLGPRGDLAQVAEGRIPLAGAIASTGGIDVIAGRSGSGALSGLGLSEAAGLMQSLKLVAARYGRTIADLGAGVEPVTLNAARLCGRVLVVLTDEPASLTDAYALIKLLRQGPMAPRFAVVVTNAESPRAAENAYQALSRACARFLGFAPPLAGAVRRDKAVREAIRAQEGLVARSPSSPAAQDLLALAARLDTVFDGAAKAA